jgi:hypothetical protein
MLGARPSSQASAIWAGHAQFHRTPQRRQSLGTVTRRTEHARTGQLHRAEADARHREKAERVTLHGLIRKSRMLSEQLGDGEASLEARPGRLPYPACVTLSVFLLAE